MTTPLKPWELQGNGSVPAGSVYVPNTNTNRLHSSAIPYPGTGGGGLINNQGPLTSSNVGPPLPPRPSQTRPIYSAYNRSSMMPYSSYGGGYSPYSSGYYNNSPYSYGGYGSYGMGMGMGMGMGNYGSRPYGFGTYGQNELTFSQLAEESASPAFQSVESFVGAFCSISAMLESTFHALYSSFRAVVGVADHLGRLKQILSALAIFRFFKWVFRRFLYLVGISKIKPAEVESLWNTLASSDPSALGDASELLEPGKPSSWPIVMFLGFIFAGPYLMWKLIKSLNLDSQTDRRKWATGEAEHFVAVVEYPFQPMSDRELDIKPGQHIRLAPARFQPADVKGWVLASDGGKIGLVPTNYIKVKGKRSRDSGPLNRPNSSLFPAASQPNSAMSSPQHHIPLISNDMQTESANSSAANSLHSSRIALDTAGVSSDDDTDTLVGDPGDNET